MDSTTTIKKPTYPGYGIDFITTTEVGNQVKSTNFDFRPGTYEHGVERGTRMVYQIMAALERMPDDGDPDGLARSAIEEAVKLTATEDRNELYTLRGDAVGLLITFDQLLIDIARTGLWRASMVKRLNEELDYMKNELNDHVESTVEFMAELGAVKASPSPAPAKQVKRAARKAVTA